MDFYPRPPRGGRQAEYGSKTPEEYFYPRPPRGGRPIPPSTRSLTRRLFLSTPSARRATVCRSSGGQVKMISIHALREEGDSRASGSCARASDFYPRPPRGGRPSSPRHSSSAGLFLSTPSARRATAKTETKSLFSNKLYNILHEFRRALIYNGSKNYPNHAKRLKNPVRRCRKNAENSPFAPGCKTQNNSRPSCSKGG